jgi:hypothetical protein
LMVLLLVFACLEEDEEVVVGCFGVSIFGNWAGMLLSVCCSRDEVALADRSNKESDASVRIQNSPSGSSFSCEGRESWLYLVLFSCWVSKTWVVCCAVWSASTLEHQLCSA